MRTFWKFFATLLVVNLILSVSLGEIPGCDFEDTVDLRGSVRYTNGSYLFEGILIPLELTAEYDYEILFEGRRIEVSKHTRGCVCKLKACVRLCCHPQARIEPNSRSCSKDLQEDLQFDPYVDVTYSNGSSISTHILQEYVPQHGLPCELLFPLNPFEYEEDDWKLFENGTLLRVFDGAYLSKLDYCLHPIEHNGSNHLFMPHNCATENQPSIMDKLRSYLIAISIVFFVFTIIVYLILPKLQNLHGKCLICYLASLTVAYLMLNINYFYNDITSHATSCHMVGYIGYFSFMSAFLWSSVISFDLWNTFRSGNFGRLRPAILFKNYNLYAWGIAVLLTVLMYVLDISSIRENWKPRVAVYTCWIYTGEWSALLYLYGPMLMLILFNVVMCVLSVKRIMEINKTLQLDEVHEEQQVKRLSSNKQTAILYFRLFFIMGIVWILEFFSFCLQGLSDLHQYFYYPGDILNCAQGIILFILLLLRPKVRKMLINRMCFKKTNSYQDNDSGERISLQEKTYGLSNIR